MKSAYKKTILLDLDGVLNTYTGDFDKNHIPEIKPGAEDFLKKLSGDYRVVIFTTRPKDLTSKWVEKHNLGAYISDITSTKIPAFLHVDDRCIPFNNNYDETIENIKTFEPWWRKKS